MVIDTNRVLDLWLFEDATVERLRGAICSGAASWLVTPAMRQELRRVLRYPALVRQLGKLRRTPEEVLARLDHWSIPCETSGGLDAGRPRCADPDDQIFVDLAMVHRAHLYSRDLQVLALNRILLRRGVVVCALDWSKGMHQAAVV